MDDRLRYRVWNKAEKELIYNAECVYDGMNFYNYNYDMIGKNRNDGHICCFVEYCIDDNYDVMQCTGLKDRNGKLIYEGDIVRLDDEYELNSIAQFHKEYDMDYGRIEFILIGGHPKCPTIYIPTVAHESEIIGNIYTTPELLKDENGN